MKNEKDTATEGTEITEKMGAVGPRQQDSSDRYQVSVTAYLCDLCVLCGKSPHSQKLELSAKISIQRRLMDVEMG